MNAEAQAVLDLIEFHREYYEDLKNKGTTLIPVDEIIKQMKMIERVGKR